MENVSFPLLLAAGSTLGCVWYDAAFREAC
jgi:hypothetical protein